MKKVNAFVLVCFWVTNVFAQNMERFEKHLFISDADTLPYRLLLPKNFDPAKKYPLVLFLHGSGERGNDNELQLVHGGKLFASDSSMDKFPAIVVFPQCPINSYWSNVNFRQDEQTRVFDFPEDGEPTQAMKLLQGLLLTILKKYPVEKKQVYVAGLSMGGMGTFEIVRRNPKLFAAAMPICGGANPATAPKLIKTHWWIFHGAKDDVVSPSLSQQMVNALQAAGAQVKFTLYPNDNHNSWDSAFAEPLFLTWLFSQKK